MISINLTDSVKRYKNESDNKKKKRALWNESVKQLLIDTISKIVSTHAIGWSMELIGSSTNVEGVTLTFGDIIIGVEPTHKEPITENTKANAENIEVKYYTKHEGTLAFTQAYNGDIFIIIVYPTIEEIINPRDTQKLEIRIDPSRITTEFIEHQVAKFLDEIVKWESSPLYNDIGFVVKR
jgi:hypothetical protein